MPTFRIPGVVESTPSTVSLEASVDGVTSKERVRVESGRASSQLQELEGEFVELQLTGGVRLWGATERLNEDLRSDSSREGGEGGTPVWPVRLGRGPGARSGGKDLAIEAVQTFELEIAGALRDFIRNRVEAGMEPGGRLRQCGAPSPSAFGAATRVGGTGPTLVFLHGTASSTEGSFGGLWEAVGANRVLRLENPGARINDLFKAYEGRVMAFEHRSLSESPVVNARALMEQLASVVPGGRELHLVSHSRGGMIGELLCRGMRRQGAPIDKLDLDQLTGDGEDRQGERTALSELGRLLEEQRYTIGRFVRVACPAAGTTLADGRLDRYVSVLVNVAGLVTGLGADPTYKALTNLLAAVLKERTKPDALPGLEAMMPESPLSKLLNRRDIVTAADLHVLGGDLAVRGFWSALKALATDFFYLEDHDLVVNTPSMLRGTPRAGTVKYFIDEDGDVSHFNYFRRADTASRLTEFLAKGSAEFRELRVEPYEVDGRAYEKRDATPMPVVVLVPGFMGSHLAVEDGRVWADPGRLARGGFAALAKAQRVTPEALVAPYISLVERLSASHEVVPFPYDWRRPAAENAPALRALLEGRLRSGTGAATQPLRILTHGSGGFVLQALFASDEGRRVWEQVCAHPGARAVMLGHPFGGTVHALLPLLGQGSLLRGLSTIDLAHRIEELVGLFAGLGGLLELLPDAAPDPGPAGWFAAEHWTSAFPPPAGLSAARARRGKLAAAAVDATRIITVAGTASITPVQVRFDGDEVRIEATTDGDGYSPWSAIPPQVRERTWLAEVDHGGLITSRELQSAIVELLTTGRTRSLAPMPSGAGRGALSPMRLRKLPAIPSDAELLAAGLGIGVRAPDVVRPKVRVRVVHGNLSRAGSPVVVGHYDQDVFANAEAYLDRQLDGRLRERHLMRLYPGPIGTAAVEVQRLADSSAKHPGAIVVGLGVVGTLTAGSLIRTLEEGLTTYGRACVAEHERRAQDDARRAGEHRPVPAPITALLVGSGEAGLSLRDSLHALLRAVLGANDRLAAPAAAAEERRTEPPPLTARIEAVDVLELYEDRAVEALRMLLALARDPDYAEAFDIEPVLEVGSEGRQRVSFEEPAAWWQRLRVSEQDASIDPKFPTSRKVLKFEAYAERARIDAYAVNSQRELARAFIDDAMATTESNQRLGRALFEMLVPNEIKERAPDRRDTVLLLDAAAAAVPWELFEDGLQRDERPRQPLSIEAGLIRQLVDEHPRQQVRQATEDRALVVGNPVVADARFADLPGASLEALAVADALAGRFDIELLVEQEATPRAILAALHEQPWRVLHLALHGVFDYPAVEGGTQLVTGAVVGAGVYLEPADFNQMRYVPELVFLNCCHGGFTGGEGHVPRYPELAANLATQFIKMGARAVVAAGWAVNDAAAEAFARTFYDEMLAGRRFGEATTRARRTIHRQFPQHNTWGAYQCYGDPEFVLARGTQDGASRPPVCLRELVVEAETIASDAKTAEESAFASLRTRLDTALQLADERWLRDARVCAALGAAYGELREFERAIHYYETAREAETAHVAMSALEQLANLQSRFAEHLWRETPKKTPAIRRRVDETFERAQGLLAQLTALAPSAERDAMLGGLEKRRAMTRTKKTDMVQALRAAEAHYRDGYDLKIARGQDAAFYPFMNAVVARMARSWLGGGERATPGTRSKTGVQIPALSAEVAQLARLEATVKKATDFWSLGLVAESELVRRVYRAATVTGSDAYRKALAAIAADDVGVRYRDAQRRGRSRREIDSVVTQVRFLARFAEQSSSARVRAIAGALEQLARQLTEG